MDVAAMVGPALAGSSRLASSLSANLSVKPNSGPSFSQVLDGVVKGRAERDDKANMTI